ncbi:MAG: hypothetical protein EPN97_08805 [Alphaproteobacteria bacterium]|nr:MAG: hypothetical protein EPN97_08805 [Alphaproteobacteria bacterium]
MGLFEKLLKDGAEAAATVIAHAVVTGGEILENAQQKRQDLGRKFDEKATKAARKVEQTRENLAQAVEDHLAAFADALETAMTEIEEEHHAAEAPQPQATVSTVTPEVVAETKPGLKSQPAAAKPAAKPKRTRKRVSKRAGPQ